MRPLLWPALGRTLLFLVILDTVTALVDLLLYWLTGGGFITVLLWATWQAATLMMLVVTVPPIFETAPSAFVRRPAVVSFVVVLQAIGFYLGFVLFGNPRVVRRAHLKRTRSSGGPNQAVSNFCVRLVARVSQ